jgi:hypothetical protein
LGEGGYSVVYLAVEMSVAGDVQNYAIKKVVEKKIFL